MLCLEQIFFNRKFIHTYIYISKNADDISTDLFQIIIIVSTLQKQICTTTQNVCHVSLHISCWLQILLWLPFLLVLQQYQDIKRWKRRREAWGIKMIIECNLLLTHPYHVQFTKCQIL